MVRGVDSRQHCTFTHSRVGRCAVAAQRKQRQAVVEYFTRLSTKSTPASDINMCCILHSRTSRTSYTLATFERVCSAATGVSALLHPPCLEPQQTEPLTFLVAL